jgi:small subunit ribosomal protein S17
MSMLRKEAMPLLHKMLKQSASAKVLRGRVATDRMQKSVTVAVPYYQYLPRMRKYVRRHRKFTAHDEHNECRIGDLVELVAVPRMAKNKHFCVTKIVMPVREADDPIFPIEAMPPTLVPERALTAKKYLPQDSYRDNLDGLLAPYVRDYVTASVKAAVDAAVDKA